MCTAYHTGKYSVCICVYVQYLHKHCTCSTGELSEEQKAALTSYFPTTEIHMIQNAGHLIHSRQPEKFIEYVCTFIDSL